LPTDTVTKVEVRTVGCDKKWWATADTEYSGAFCQKGFSPDAAIKNLKEYLKAVSIVWPDGIEPEVLK